jgi:WD40 repeat protein
LPVAWEAAAISDCGEYVATATVHGPVHVWDESVPHKGSWLYGHADVVDHLVFSKEQQGPGTDNLGTISRDGKLFIWFFGCCDQIGEANVCYEDLLHFSYIRSLESWLVVERRHGLRFYDNEGVNFGNFTLPEGSTVTAVASDTETRLMVISRLTGDVEIWNTLALCPYVPFYG